MRYSKAIVACFAAMAMASCNKDDKTPSPTPSPSTNKIVGSWKCISAKGDKPLGQYADGTFSYDFYEKYILEDCRRDDLTIFYDGGKFDMDEGPTKCDPSAPQLIGSGSWSIKGDTLNLTNISNGQSSQSRITQLDATTLKIESQGKHKASLLHGDTVYANLILTSTYTRQ